MHTKKTTFWIDGDCYRQFMQDVQDLNLRRDRYLNEAVLPDFLDALEETEPLSDDARTTWKALRKFMRKLLTPVSVKVESTLLTRLNSVCEQKGMPRDMFLETALQRLSDLDYGPAPLGRAATILANATTWRDDNPFDGFETRGKEALLDRLFEQGKRDPNDE
jgi:hypothetical protein